MPYTLKAQGPHLSAKLSPSYTMLTEHLQALKQLFMKLDSPQLKINNT